MWSQKPWPACHESRTWGHGVGGSVGVPGFVTPRLWDAAFVAWGGGDGYWVGGLPLPNCSLTLAYAVSASNTLDQLGLDPGSSLEISYRA